MRAKLPSPRFLIEQNQIASIPTGELRFSYSALSSMELTAHFCT